MMFETCSSEETRNVGYHFGKTLMADDVVALDGDLGVGKTQFIAGAAKALGYEGIVTSPTFTIVNEYMGRFPVYHLDVYRLANADDLFDIGFEEYLYGGVAFIEWAQNIVSALPQKYWQVTIEKELKRGDDYRKIVIERVERT